jgi:uncharacterized protein YjiS (DUF1127 family)
MAKGDSIMERFQQNSIPAIAAAHIAALTTVSAAPAFRGVGPMFRWRAEGPRSEIFDTGWRPNPAAILHGWKPRRLEAQPARRQWAPVRELLATVLDRVALWQERSRSRQALLAMDDRALHDIGLDRASADYEGNLPFWRVRP